MPGNGAVIGDELDDMRDYGLVARVRATERWDGASWNRRGRFWRWLLVDADEPAPSFQEPVEDPPPSGTPDRIGICCSGGGIRSASFNLGVLQEIGPVRLQQAKYLAAVSGGAYIAGAFAMVANTKTPPADVNSSPDLVDEQHPPFYPGSPEEQYLRNRVSYLAPSGGGMLRLVWRVICGLVVNLTLITSAAVLLAAAVAYYYRRYEPGLDSPTGNYAASPSPWVFWTTLGVAAFGLFLGVMLVLWRPKNEKASRRLEAWSLRLTIVGAVFFALGVVLPELLVEIRQGRDVGETTRVIGRSIGGTIAGILFAIFLQIRARAGDPKQAVAEVGKVKSWLDGLAAPVRRFIVGVAAYVLGPLLIAAIFVGATLLQVAVEGRWLVVIPAVALVVFLWLYFWGDLTSWSLHPYYRRRLCTAFALKRVKRLDSNGNEIVDDQIGRAAERDQRQLVRLSETRVVPAVGKWESRKWPTLVVCAAANVSDPGATPPGRSVNQLHLQRRDDGRASRRRYPDHDVRGEAREKTTARLQSSGGRRDVWSRLVPVDGQAHARQSSLPHGARERAPWRLGAESAEDRRVAFSTRKELQTTISTRSLREDQALLRPFARPRGLRARDPSTRG